MSRIRVVESITTVWDSGAEPDTVRRRQHTVSSKQVRAMTVGDIADFFEALQEGAAPYRTEIRIGDKDVNGWFHMVAEWSENVDIEEAAP